MREWRVKTGQKERVITKRQNRGVMIELKLTISHFHGQLTELNGPTQLLHAKENKLTATAASFKILCLTQYET